MKTSIHVASALPCLALCFVACAPPNESCADTATTSSAIKFGDVDAGVTPVPAQQTVFALHWVDPEEDMPRYVCTATRVEGGAFVTARHCLPELPSSPSDAGERRAPTLVLQQVVLDGSPHEGCTSTAPLEVTKAEAHDSLDLAVLHVDKTLPEESEALMTFSTAEPLVGETMVIAGFGLTEDTSLGQLRALPARLQSVDNESISVQAIGGGACVGDSGGPLYRVDDETGTATLVGVLSAGSATCLGSDIYVDVARAVTWLRSRSSSTTEADR